MELINLPASCLHGFYQKVVPQVGLSIYFIHRFNNEVHCLLIDFIQWQSLHLFQQCLFRYILAISVRYNCVSNCHFCVYLQYLVFAFTKVVR